MLDGSRTRCIGDVSRGLKIVKHVWPKLKESDHLGRDTVNECPFDPLFKVGLQFEYANEPRLNRLENTRDASLVFLTVGGTDENNMLGDRDRINLPRQDKLHACGLHGGRSLAQVIQKTYRCFLGASKLVEGTDRKEVSLKLSTVELMAHRQTLIVDRIIYYGMHDN